jgi:gluconate 2-dehydrogenase gamma chain
MPLLAYEHSKVVEATVSGKFHMRSDHRLGSIALAGYLERAAACACIARSDEPPTFQFFSLEQAAEVEAMSTQIIPTDDAPGAREARVVYFIDRVLTTFDRHRQPEYTQGLGRLPARAQKMFPGEGKFSRLRSAQQIRLLTAIQNTKFFELVRVHTVMGLLANPEYGEITTRWVGG